MFTFSTTTRYQAKVLFGFPIEADPHSEELLNSKRFRMHASYLLQVRSTHTGIDTDIVLIYSN